MEGVFLSGEKRSFTVFLGCDYLLFTVIFYNTDDNFLKHVKSNLDSIYREYENLQRLECANFV